MPRLTQIDPTQAQGETKDLFNAVQTKMGAVPNLIRVMGNQPAVLTAYLGNSAALQSGTFDAKTREAIALVTAGFNGCTYCASAHTYIAKSLNVDADESRRYIDGKSNDPKVQAILTFSLRVLETRGKVSDDDLAAARNGGLDDGEIAEVIANVVANIFTNYLNNAARTDIDFPIVDLTTAKAA